MPRSALRWIFRIPWAALVAVDLFIKAGEPTAQGILHLISPLDYQVFQRFDRTNGFVVVEGSLDGGSPSSRDRLEARMTGGPLSENSEAAWQALPFDPRVRRFFARLKMPSGGWRQFEARLIRDGAVVVQSRVEHVGVGEIFVIAGQSNSANHGEERQSPKSPLVVSFGNGKWQPAADPQPGASGNGGSFAPAFGDAMVERFKVPIGLVSIGVGATSVREWLLKGDAIAAPPTTGANTMATGPNSWASTGVLFDHLTAATRQLGQGGFRALLWHQGESDNHQPADREISPSQYRAYLERLILASRGAAGWRIPWFVAQASYHVPSDPGSPKLRAVQAAIAADGVALAGPNTDLLGSSFRENGGQGVHFNAAGLRRHGEMWAESVTPWLETQLGR